MEKQDTVTSGTHQSTPSRIALEQHVRARAWKDDAFRQEFLTNPYTVLERDYAQYFPEGQIPSNLSIKVIEEEEQVLCFVLPQRLSDDQLLEWEQIEDNELLGISGGAAGDYTNGTISFCKTWCKGGGCQYAKQAEAFPLLKRL